MGHIFTKNTILQVSRHVTVNGNPVNVHTVVGLCVLFLFKT